MPKGPLPKSSRRAAKPVVHGTPIEKDDNLLDRFSSGERLDYFAKTFFAVEKALVAEKVTTVVPRGNVLNVGCGRHGTERILFPKPNYAIYGVDTNEESLRILANQRTYEGLAKGSITSLPVPSAAVDVVYLRLILHHLVAPRNLLGDGLQECFRVLKPGGMLVLVEPNSWHPVGALMNLAHALRLDMYIHGTNDDVALSPLMLRRRLSLFASDISTHVVSYAWRRLPISVQELGGRMQARMGRLSEKVPFFGHTLMMTAVKD
jgi:SAM-dependent methyltransferase